MGKTTRMVGPLAGPMGLCSVEMVRSKQFTHGTRPSKRTTLVGTTYSRAKDRVSSTSDAQRTFSRKIENEASSIATVL